MSTLYNKAGKRIFDLVVVLMLSPVAIPLMLVAGALVRMAMGSPVLFRQVRPGIGGQPFVIIKFRTMLGARDRAGRELEDAERLTRTGRFLRASSLDELPELWNVVRGEMSLVGPRPLLMEYVPLYTPEQARRHLVKPGITGWAQINGRNSLTWDEKFRLDAWYVDNVSLLLDAKILFLTAKRVVARSGISHGGEATMPRFTGRPM